MKKIILKNPRPFGEARVFRSAIVEELGFSFEKRVKWLECRHYSRYSAYAGLTRPTRPADLKISELQKMDLKAHTVFKISVWPHPLPPGTETATPAEMVRALLNMGERK
jgi:hypothetical protein